MPCPPEIAEILVEMLAHGLLSIRAAGWAELADRCAIEADHLHNLLDLLEDFTPERLAYYWNVERPGYAAQCRSEDLSAWEPFWRRLEPLVGPIHESAGAGS